MSNQNRSNQKGEVPAVPEGYVRIKFLRPHTSYAYFENDVCYLTRENAEKLLQVEEDEQPFIELLPDDWQEPTATKNEIIPDEDLIEVKWLIPHISFAYSSGDLGRVSKEHIEKLLEGKYIELVTSKHKHQAAIGKKSKNSLFNKVFGN